MIQYMLLQLRRRLAKLTLFTVLLSLSGALVAVSAGLWIGTAQSTADATSAFTTIAFRKDLPRSNPLTLFQPLTYNWDDVQIAYAYWQGDIDGELTVAQEHKTEYILQSEQIYAMWAENAPQVIQADRRQIAFGYAPQILAKVPALNVTDAFICSDMYNLAVFLAEYREEDQFSDNDPNNDGTVKCFNVVDAVSVYPGTALPASIVFRTLNMPEFQEGLYLLFGEYTVSGEGIPILYDRPTPMSFDFSLEKRLEMPVYLPDGLDAFAQKEPALYDSLCLLIESLDITHHSVQIFGTDNLRSILPFAAKEAVIVEGRGFDAMDYEEGKDICLMPAGLARQNGLSVGDTVSFKVYRGFPLITSTSLWMGGLYGVSAVYYNLDGVQGSGFEEEKTYMIVGIYQAPEWQIDDHALTPNTMIVPNRSLEKNYFGVPLGVFYSLILENGSIQAFEETMTNEGLGGEFAYYDQGFSNVTGTIEKMRKNAMFLLSISGLVWLTMLFFFILFYVLKSQTNIAILRALGASKMQAFAYEMLGVAIITLAAGCIGGGIGLAVYDHAANVALKAALQQNQVNLSYSDLVLGNTSDWFTFTKSFAAVTWASVLQCIGVLSTAAVCCAVQTQKRLLRMLRSSEA